MLGNLFGQKKQSTLVRYGVIIIALIMWYIFILSPINAKIEAKRTELEAQQLKIQRLKKRIKNLANIDKEFSQEKNRFENLKKRLIPGDTLQLVATNMQNAFLQKAKEAGVEVLVYRSGSSRRWRSYRLAVSIFNLQSDLPQFLELLQALDREKRFQRINNVNFSSVRGKKSEYRINMEIEGLFLGDKAKL